MKLTLNRDRSQNEDTGDSAPFRDDIFHFRKFFFLNNSGSYIVNTGFVQIFKFRANNTYR